MAEERMLTGCSAAAQAAKAAEVEVICSYPIRPYTAIMMELAKMVADGELATVAARSIPQLREPITVTLLDGSEVTV